MHLSADDEAVELAEEEEEEERVGEAEQWHGHVVGLARGRQQRRAARLVCPTLSWKSGRPMLTWI